MIKRWITNKRNWKTFLINMYINGGKTIKESNWDLYSLIWDIYSTVWDLRLTKMSLFNENYLLSGNEIWMQKTCTQKHLAEQMSGL